MDGWGGTTSNKLQEKKIAALHDLPNHSPVFRSALSSRVSIKCACRPGVGSGTIAAVVCGPRIKELVQQPEEGGVVVPNGTRVRSTEYESTVIHSRSGGV